MGAPPIPAIPVIQSSVALRKNRIRKHSATFHSSELPPCWLDNSDPADPCLVTVRFPWTAKTLGGGRVRVSPFSRTPHTIQDFIRGIHVVLFGVKAVSRQILYGGDFGRIEVDVGARWSAVGIDRSPPIGCLTCTDSTR